jgi:hypothetical protein
VIGHRGIAARSSCGDVNNGVGKGFRSLLREVVPDAVLDQPMRVFAGRISSRKRAWRLRMP